VIRTRCAWSVVLEPREAVSPRRADQRDRERVGAVAGALQDHDRAVIVDAELRQGPVDARLSPGGRLGDRAGRRARYTPCGRVIQRQYRGITRRDYFRLGARTRYGGSSVVQDGRRANGVRRCGIYPTSSCRSPTLHPCGSRAAREDDLPLKWVGGYVSAAAHRSGPRFLGAHPVLPAAAQETFRTFAAAQGSSFRRTRATSCNGSWCARSPWPSGRRGTLPDRGGVRSGRGDGGEAIRPGDGDPERGQAQLAERPRLRGDARSAGVAVMGVGLERRAAPRQ